MANQSLINFLVSGKARIFSIVTGAVVVAGAGGYWFYHHRQVSALQAGAAITQTADIKALPGVGHPSQAYMNSVQYTNKQAAVQAARHGQSNVPTLTKASFVGNPQDFLGGTSDMTSHSCKKPHADPQACSIAALKQARKSGVTADELKCKGCQCPAMKSVGFTAGDLKKAGFDAKGLKECGFSAAQLKAAGFTAKELKDAGFTAKQLKDAGFTAKQLRDAGFSAKDLKNAGYSDADIANAGYSPAELSAAGITALKRNDECSPEALKKAHDAGVSAQAMRAKGCGLAALIGAGYDANDLRNAGYSAKQLADGGFSPNSLRHAGFSANDLKNAGLSAGQLKDAGFTADDLAKAGYTPDELHAAGFDADQLHKAGLTSKQLKQAGYTSGDLIRAGYTPAQAGYVDEHAHDFGAAINHGMNTALQAGSMQAANSSGIPSVASGSLEGRLAEIKKIQEQQFAAQQQQQALSQEEANMAQQAQQFQRQWGNVAVQQYTQQKAPKSVAETGAAAMAAASGHADANSGPVLKAGTVMFAVLDTGVNTDNAGSPVMARIITGPLKGTKLMGQFARVDKQVQLRFNVASVPSLANSISINAVAIDQNTAQTAMQGNVNNHYLLRYGSMFASAFISGMADAIQSGGGSTMIGPGFIWRSHDKLNTAQQVAVGLGNVGQQYASSMSDNFNRAPTIKIPGGTGLGVLLMGDLQLPTSIKLQSNAVKASQQG